jgi:septal ring factor EnvC (AmiA/AmiB activator)
MAGSAVRLRPLALVALAGITVAVSASIYAQTERARTDANARRVNERIQALQREADRLAGESRTLLGDLSKLEIERDLQVERLNEAQRAVAESQKAVQRLAERFAQLEQQRVAQLPSLKTQLVDLYKRGRAGYARLLFGANDLREFARATRAVAALSRLNEQRIEDHRRTLDAVKQQRAELERKTSDLKARENDARQARAAADRAIRSRTALIDQIDARRDLTAQLAGELQVAYERMQQQIANASAGRAVEPVAVPLAPFRGALEWPATGRVLSRFGQTSARPGGGVRNGIEIAAAEGTPVKAVHGGTVTYAEPFTGFGTLVIVDHGGDNASLYGYLGSPSVERGATVETGTELGRVGSAPGGPSALYFEMRIDGRSVDPVQWLKPR